MNKEYNKAEFGAIGIIIAIIILTLIGLFTK